MMALIISSTAIRPLSRGMTRALHWMQDRATPFTADELAQAIYVVRRQAQHLLRQLHEADIVHIAAWRKSTGAGAQGRPAQRLWLFGTASDAPKPPNDDAATIRRRRVKRLRATYGQEMTTRILYGGASTVCMDGVTYRKGRPRGRSGGRRAEVAA